MYFALMDPVTNRVVTTLVQLWLAIPTFYTLYILWKTR